MFAVMHLTRKLLKLAASIALAVSVGTVAAKEILQFPITEFKVEGNTLLEPDLVDATLQPFVGRQSDFADVQRALDALEAAYRARGYDYVSVLLPEQVLERGIVRLQVIEARIRSVSIEGQQHFSPANIRASVPALKEDEIPLMKAISASLRIANENPAKKIRVLFEPGEKDEDLKATIRVADEPPSKFGLSLDNTGTVQTGRNRLGVSYQNSNLFDRDHVLSLLYLTSVEQPQDVSTYAVAYRVPLYARGDVLDFYAIYSDVDSGIINAGAIDLAIVGKGSVQGFRYTTKLARRGDYEHELTLGLENKIYKNSALAGGTQLGNDLTIHPLTVQYAGLWTQETIDLAFYVSLVRNIPGGKDGDQAAFNLARIGSNDDYSLLRVGGSFNKALAGDWYARLATTAQWANSPLVPGEQFGAGGANSVRGFRERDVSNDKGFQGNLELYTQELCASRLAGAQCRLVGFYDFASLSRNDPLIGEVTTDHIASVGLGLRGGFGRNFSLQADYGYIVQGGGPRKAGDSMVHFRLAAFF